MGMKIRSRGISILLPEGAIENSPGLAKRSPGNAAESDSIRPVGASEFPQLIFPRTVVEGTAVAFRRNSSGPTIPYRRFFFLLATRGQY
jgi:hypothetical protein